MARPPASSLDHLRLALHAGPLSAKELCQRLGVSQPTISRMLRDAREWVISGGSTRSTRYALPRQVSSLPSQLPVVRVAENGTLVNVGVMAMVYPNHSWFSFDALGWPDDPECLSGFRDGLPYFVSDMQPQGYLGRAFAQQIASALRLPSDPRKWSDDDVLVTLACYGSDLPGNLIIGDEAIQRFEEQLRLPPKPLPDNEQLPLAYEQLAINAGRSGNAGSSAAGEFPKFTAIRESHSGHGTPHVIVKFSGNDRSPPVTRWADLLTCEHLALETIAKELQLPSAYSRILHYQGRTFLEVERFDRVGMFGRRGVASLGALNNALLGSSLREWADLVPKLATVIHLAEEDVRKAQLLYWFGVMIANTDMHFGNLSFMMGDKACLAPAYDMLPMKYAPLAGGEVQQAELLDPNRFTLPYSQRSQLASIWNKARQAALVFWRTAASDPRITLGFREICQGNLAVIEAVPPLVGR